MTSSNLNSIPPEAAPYLGLLLADLLHHGNFSGYLRQLPDPGLRQMAAHIARCEPLLSSFLDALGLPQLDQPSWWVSQVLPAIKTELDRRHRKVKLPKGTGPIAKLKQLDLVQVAARFTQLKPAGVGKLKGLCPLHHEKTPSFYIFTANQRWRCFGACASGGDVVDLLARLEEKGALS
jgi:hypothetical protein